MNRSAEYRAKLRELDDWDDYLLAESHLPGPRANLELADVVAEEGAATRFRRWLQTPSAAPAGEFLAACAVIGLGRLLSEGDTSALADLRAAAADTRWRVREGVAIGLQKWGKRDMAALLDEMDVWSRGNAYERRAAAAALCEPPLLRDNLPAAARTLSILDAITAAIPAETDRKSDAFQALRKALGYCWSVAAVAAPSAGKAALERWFAATDRDIVWIMRENLKKDRLRRLDPAWTAHWQAKLSQPQ